MFLRMNCACTYSSQKELLIMSRPWHYFQRGITINNKVALLQCASRFNWLFNESDLKRSESYMFLVSSLADLSRAMMGEKPFMVNQCFQSLCAMLLVVEGFCKTQFSLRAVNTVHTEKHGLYCTYTDRDYLKRKVAPNMILARR